MRIFLTSFLISFALMLSSCEKQVTVKNFTRPGGYALGERVTLAFFVSGGEPDSLEVKIFEKKTEYTYDIFAAPVDTKYGRRYECVWDGRKPDGAWPAGGRYWVYAVIPDMDAVSDTVEIGLTD